MRRPPPSLDWSRVPTGDGGLNGWGKGTPFDEPGLRAPTLRAKGGGGARLPRGADGRPDTDALAEVTERLRALGMLPNLGGLADGWEEDRPQVGDGCVRPAPGLGVNNVALSFEPGSADYRERGAPGSVLSDLAELGAGFGRQLGPADLLVGILFDGRSIPPPDLMLAELREARGAFSAFTSALLLAISQGVALTPTLFCWGGGSALNEEQNEDGGSRFVGDSNITWEQVNRGRPRGQGACIVPSEAGWDGWYWDFAEPDDTDLKSYQRFALNLHDYGERTNARDADYMAHAAARKRLGVAAFATAVGEALGLMERELGRELWRGLHWIELGNEFDTFWGEDAAVEFGRFLALLAGPILNVSPNAPLRAGEISSWSVNRFRLRSGGGVLADNRREAVWGERLRWLREALKTGMQQEVDHWADVEDQWAEAATARFGFSLWNTPDLSAALNSDVFWPPLPEFDGRGRVTRRFSPSDERRLLRQVGFHYYHTTDENLEGRVGTERSLSTLYEGELRLMSDATRFDRLVVQHLNALGWNLTWSVCETSFPSTSNPLDDVTPDASHQPHSSNASEMMQASVLLRRLLCLRAVGAAVIAWHGWMTKPKFEVPQIPTGQTQVSPDATIWTLFSGSGLRLDLWPSAYSSPSDWRAANFAYPRPAWFSFRRLAWLLNRSGGVERALATREGLVVIRLEALDAMPFYVPDDAESEAESTEHCGGRSAKGEFRYCYVLWMDQYTEPAGTEGYGREDTAKVLFTGAPTSGFEQLPLVPRITLPTLSRNPPQNDKGYPENYTVDWRWSGWDWAEVSSSSGAIEVTLRRASNKGSPNPVCILTQSDRVSSS